MQKRTPDVPSVSVSTEMKRKTPHLLYRCFFFGNKHHTRCMELRHLEMITTSANDVATTKNGWTVS